MKNCNLLKVNILLSVAFIYLAFASFTSTVLAQMEYPISVASDGQQIVIGDLNLPGVWSVNGGKATKLIEGVKKFKTPLNRVRSVAIDQNGKVLVGDSATRDVYRIDDGNAIPLTKGQIGIPMSIAVNKAGNLIVADLELGRIYEVPAAGGEPKKLADVLAPRGVFVDKEDVIWVVTGLKDPLIKLDVEGKPIVVVKGRPFEYPSSVVVDAEGNAFVCDSYAKAVWKIGKEGEPVKWSQGEEFSHPVGLALKGDEILLIDSRAKALFSIDKEGKATKVALE